MKRKVLSVLLAATMVFSMAACGNQPANGDNKDSEQSGGGSSTTATPEPAAAATATPDPRSEGEILADQYNGFVETPMDLGGRTIRIACSVGSRYNYVQTDGKDDPDKTNEATIEIIKILEGIEQDYNCKFEITPSRKGKNIVEDLVTGMAEGKPYYDIIDEGVSDTYLDQIFSQGLVMDMNDPAIKDIIKFDTNPWKVQSDYANFNGTQYGVNFITKNSSNDLRNAVLFNVDLAEQYGLGDIYQMVRDNKWTWEVFEEMCEKIVQQSGGSVVPAGYGKENLIFPMVLSSNNAATGRRDANGKMQYTALEQEALDAANWIYSLREKGYLAPNWTTKVEGADGKSTKVPVEGGIAFEKDGEKLFEQGACVFFFDFYGDLQKLTLGTVQTEYSFGLLPCPIGPNGDKCHGVTYSTDIKMIAAGIEKPEEVAAVLVAIANRTSKTPENVYENEMKNTLQDEGSLDMFKIMYEDMRSDYSRAYTKIGIGGAGDKILKLESTPQQAYEAIAEETQGIYDGTVKKW